MKALSIYPDFTLDIVVGDKTIECRSWKTNYRGDLLICSTAHKMPDTIPGMALAVVSVIDVVPFRQEHLCNACFDTMPPSGSFAWIFDDIRLIQPFPVKGKQGLYTVDIEPVFFPSDISWDELDSIYEPLFV